MRRTTPGKRPRRVPGQVCYRGASISDRGSRLRAAHLTAPARSAGHTAHGPGHTALGNGKGLPAAGARRAHERRDWALALPPLATLAVMLAGIGSASFWRDEAATLTATRRSLPDLARMLRHVDAVHATYYLVMWPVAHLFGTSEFVMRFPSAVAMTAACAGIVLIGRRLGSRATGLLAGLVFSALPMASRYGQEARSYALVTAVAVLASYLLIRLVDEPERRWPLAYGASVTMLGLLNVLALLIIPAHGISLAVWRRGMAGSRAAGGRGDAAAAHSTRAWVAGAVTAGAAALPVAALAWAERGQLAWLTRPTLTDVWTLLTVMAGSGTSLMLLCALAVAGATHRGPPRGAGPAGSQASRRLVSLSVPWLLVPPCLLISASQIKPLYVDRYLVFCLPAMALLAGAGLTVQGRCRRVAALGMIALLALPVQRAIRQPWGHGDDIRAAARLVQALARPGDAVVYRKPGARDVGAAYSYGFTKLADIGRAESAVAAGNLSGTEIPFHALERRLRTVGRVWVVRVGSARAGPAPVRHTRFRLIGKWLVSHITLRLYARRAGRVRPRAARPGRHHP